MGDYSQRSTELAALVAEFAAASPSEQERQHFAARVPEYLEARRRRLDELVEAIADVCEAGSEPEPRWRRVVEGLATDAAHILGQILSGIGEPSAAAIALKYRMQSEEERFIRPLLDAGVAARWGQLGPLRREVDTMDRSLRARWAGLVEKSAEIDRAQGELATAIRDRLRTLREDAAREQTAAAAALASAADTASRLGDGNTDERWYERARAGIGPVFATVAATTAAASASADRTAAAATAARTELARLRALQEAEVGGLHRLFHEARAEAAQLRAASRADRGTALVREGQDLLASWAAAQTGSALQSDAGALARDLAGRTAPALAALTAAWDALIREHDGRFFGSLSSATTAALRHPSEWAARQGWYAELPAALAELRARGGGLDVGALRTAVDALAATARARLAAREQQARSAEEHRRDLESRFASARVELTHYLPTDSDQEAFFLDYFPNAARPLLDVPSDLTRSDKFNRVFEIEGVDPVLRKAREVFWHENPFDGNDVPTRPREFAVVETDREVLLSLMRTASDLEALALDYFPQAAKEFASDMTNRRKAALVLATYGGTAVLKQAREYFWAHHPFDDRDLPTRPWAYPVSESDRDALAKLFVTDNELDGFATEAARRAALEFKPGMTRRQRAGLILAIHSSDIMRSAREYYCKIHPFDDTNRPTRPGGYPISDSDRERILAAFPISSDLEAFAIDYFPRAHTDFANGLNKTQQASLLLWHYGSSDVMPRLDRVLAERAKP